MEAQRGSSSKEKTNSAARNAYYTDRISFGKAINSEKNQVKLNEPIRERFEEERDSVLSRENNIRLSSDLKERIKLDINRFKEGTKKPDSLESTERTLNPGSRERQRPMPRESDLSKNDSNLYI